MPWHLDFHFSPMVSERSIVYPMQDISFQTLLTIDLISLEHSRFPYLLSLSPTPPSCLPCPPLNLYLLLNPSSSNTAPSFSCCLFLIPTSFILFMLAWRPTVFRSDIFLFCSLAISLPFFLNLIFCNTGRLGVEPLNLLCFLHLLSLFVSIGFLGDF